MSRRVVHRVLLVVVLLAVGAAAGGWWWVAFGRYPLAGSRSHDFGDVLIAELSGSASHTFRLRNRTGETVVIETVQPGCGCTKAEPSTRRVEPGAEVEIDVTLTLSKAGKKRTHVALVLEGFGPEVLFVEGVGRKALGITLSTNVLALPRDAPATLHVFAEVQGSDDEPPAPVVRGPDGVTATFAGWTMQNEPDPKRATARRWKGRFDVVRTVETLPPRARLTIEVGRALPAAVMLRAED